MSEANYSLLPFAYRCLHIEFNQLKINAIEIISMFGSTYICEQFFSVFKLRINDHSTKISDENLKHYLKVASTQNIRPDIHSIIETKQYQLFH